jgi:hypothetical protein
MSLDPSLALIPCAFDTGKLYSVLPVDGSGDFTVSRNGTATYLGADGLLKTAQANEPRLEFNTDGSFRGVLVEHAATNLLLRSNTLIGTGWLLNESTTTADFGHSPRGLLEATRWLSNLDTTVHALSFGPSGILENMTYTVSMWVKSNTGSNQNFRLIVSSSFLSNDFTATNEWQRFSFTATRGTIGTRYGILRDSLNSPNDLLVWGAQLETGSVATSYIPTVASQVTRPADIITVEEPVGISEIKTTLNGTESTITPTGGTYQLPNGHVSRVLML